jgi:small subunit ribosomal protein S16
MLALRLQRTGRSGHSQFRLVAQDSRFSPTRGRIVEYLGNYNPHTKEFKFEAKKVSKYIDNGAQPSDKVARLLKKEGVKLPVWVKLDEPRERNTRNPEKRRSTAPAQPEAPAEETPTAEVETATEAETPVEEPAAETPVAETATEPEAPAETLDEAPAEDAPATEEPAEAAKES